MMRIRLYILLLFIAQLAVAQLPQTDIYSFDIGFEKDSLRLDRCEFLTGFNKGGYNNQMYFIDNNKILISSNYYNEKSTDIIQLDFRINELSRVTNSESSVYSPQLRPGTGELSVVSVEDNGDQVLVLYDQLDSKTEKRRILSIQNKVAYYKWLNKDKLILINLAGDNVMNMEIAEVGNIHSSPLVEDVGRCVKMDPLNTGSFYFVHKLTSEFWYLKHFDLNTNKVSIVVQMMDKVEDFEVLDSGQLILGNKSKIYRFLVGKDKNWKELSDLKAFGIQNIKRLILKGERLIVCNSK